MNRKKLLGEIARGVATSGIHLVIRPTVATVKNGGGVTVGGRIAQARRKLAVRRWQDITRPELARELGVAAATFTRWEADVMPPSAAAFARLAEVLGVSERYLRRG